MITVKEAKRRVHLNWFIKILACIGLVGCGVATLIWMDNPIIKWMGLESMYTRFIVGDIIATCSFALALVSANWIGQHKNEHREMKAVVWRDLHRFRGWEE